MAIAAALFTLVTGCSAGTGGHGPAASSVSAPVSATAAVRAVLRFDGHTVGITLTDTAASRDLAARLPLRVHLGDAWGQAKTGRMADPLTVDGIVRTRQPRPGGVYYWPDTATLAIYYADLGQGVPPEGLIRLGSVQAGLAALADGGGQLEARVTLAPEFR